MMVAQEELKKRLWKEKKWHEEDYKQYKSDMDAGIVLGLALAIGIVDGTIKSASPDGSPSEAQK